MSRLFELLVDLPYLPRLFSHIPLSFSDALVCTFRLYLFIVCKPCFSILSTLGVLTFGPHALTSSGLEVSKCTMMFVIYRISLSFYLLRGINSLAVSPLEYQDSVL